MTRKWAEFEEFVAACGPRLLRSAWLLTGDSYLAEDLLQTALVRAWPKWHRIANEHPEAYVRRIILHTHASWWRRHWRHEVPHDQLPDAQDEADRYGELDQGRELAAMLGLLPRRQRAVVVLRYVENLSVKETAALLGCSVGTVKSQAAKALRTLRTKLPDPATAAATTSGHTVQR